MSERFDTLVVGAGPAGIAAAASAANTGQRVGLVDDNLASGGQIWRSGASQPAAARRWFAKLDAASVRRLQGSWRVFDFPANGVLRAECENGNALSCITESSFSRPERGNYLLPFPGWTLPNVMGAGGLDAMVRGGLPIAGKRVVVAGTGPLLLAVAAHLARRGAKIVAICEQASMRRLVSFAARLLGEPAKLLQGIEYRAATFGAKFYTNCWPVAGNGKEKFETVTLERDGRRWDERCDYLACGYHLTPNLELPALLECTVIEDGFVVTNELQCTSVPDVLCAGEPTGIGGVELALLEGQIAGLAAAGKTKEATKLARRRQRRLGFIRALQDVTALDPRLKSLASDSTLVCRCEDVSYGALRGQPSWRDAKLHTRCGMGPCQGRICGAAAEFLFGWSADSALSGARPPVFPARVASLALPGKVARQAESLATSIVFE